MCVSVGVGSRHTIKWARSMFAMVERTMYLGKATTQSQATFGEVWVRYVRHVWLASRRVTTCALIANSRACYLASIQRQPRIGHRYPLAHSKILRRRKWRLLSACIALGSALVLHTNNSQRRPHRAWNAATRSMTKPHEAFNTNDAIS